MKYIYSNRASDTLKELIKKDASISGVDLANKVVERLINERNKAIEKGLLLAFAHLTKTNKPFYLAIKQTIDENTIRYETVYVYDSEELINYQSYLEINYDKFNKVKHLLIENEVYLNAI